MAGCRGRDLAEEFVVQFSLTGTLVVGVVVVIVFETLNRLARVVDYDNDYDNDYGGRQEGPDASMISDRFRLVITL